MALSVYHNLENMKTPFPNTGISGIIDTAGRERPGRKSENRQSEGTGVKILLISSDNTGHGHKSIAAALTEQFARHEDVEVQVVDGFSWIAGEVGIYMSKTYGPTTRYAKTLHRLTYELGNRSVAGVSELVASRRSVLPPAEMPVAPIFSGLKPCFAACDRTTRTARCTSSQADWWIGNPFGRGVR